MNGRMDEYPVEEESITIIDEKNRNYREHGVIGKGAYGVVYLVTHVPSNVQVTYLAYL